MAWNFLRIYVFIAFFLENSGFGNERSVNDLEIFFSSGLFFNNPSQGSKENKL